MPSSVELAIASDGDRWAAVAVSADGEIFVRTSESSEIFTYAELGGDPLSRTAEQDKEREERFGPNPDATPVEKPFYVLSGTLEDPKIELR